MYEIDLSPYVVEVKKQTPRGLKREKGAYDVKGSILEVLFTFQLTPDELLEMDKLAEKVKACSNGKLLLTDDEYGKLVQTIDVIKGFGPSDVEFCRRIKKAPQVKKGKVKAEAKAN